MLCLCYFSSTVFSKPHVVSSWPYKIQRRSQNLVITLPSDDGCVCWSSALLQQHRAEQGARAHTHTNTIHVAPCSLIISHSHPCLLSVQSITPNTQLGKQKKLKAPTWFARHSPSTVNKVFQPTAEKFPARTAASCWAAVTPTGCFGLLFPGSRRQVRSRTPPCFWCFLFECDDEDIGAVFQRPTGWSSEDASSLLFWPPFKLVQLFGCLCRMQSHKTSEFLQCRQLLLRAFFNYLFYFILQDMNYGDAIIVWKTAKFNFPICSFQSSLTCLLLTSCSPLKV